MMGSKGFVLLGLLLILSALCHSGQSLMCYNCINPVGACTVTTNCSQNFDACLSVQAGTRAYYQCWTFSNCNFNYLSKYLGEKELKYDCCQKNLCNKSAGTSISGKTLLLVAPLLAALWRFFL